MQGLRCLVLFVLLQGGTWGGQANQDHGDEKSDNEVSIVKRAAGRPYTRRSTTDKNFIRFGRSGNYFHELPDPTRAKNVMSFARVSRAAKDNFMRFGRPDTQLSNLYLPSAADDPSAVSMRIGRAKDNFMRFGRKDNFMRFGRGKDNFMRYGRAKDNFMRFGRAKDNFMRFGRGKDDNFMRFGRKDNFMRFGRGGDDSNNEEPIVPDYIDKNYEEKPSFVRFGKSPRKESNFIRFGRAEPEDPEDQKIDDNGPEVDPGDLDLQADKPKNGPIVRIKRHLEPTSLWEVEANSAGRSSRDSEILEEVPATSEADSRNIQKRYIHPDIVFDPESGYENDWELLESNPNLLLLEDKRDAGRNRLIRFG